MQKVVSYNESEIKKGGSREDIGRGYNVWVDLVDPSKEEIKSAQMAFGLDEKCVEEYFNKSKKPQVRFLSDQTFTIFLGIKFDDAKTLLTEAVYLFHGEGWLVTIHSSKLDLASAAHSLLEEKNRPIMETSIDALYYSILANIVDSFEQLLTAIELSVTDFERASLYHPSRKMLEYLDDVSMQIIVLRRHFWHVRDVINSLIHINEDKRDIKFLKIVYDDINQLIQLVESYQDTVNSTRELYIANVSLQMNDTVRTLTLFSAILLPLTFLSSVYGMNGLDLNNIRSLPIGFAIILVTMAVISGILLLFFRNKKWIFVKSPDFRAGRKAIGKLKES
ncbi:MAG TPA: magnesium transporter CorA family protein [Nitrososphaera sp.]|jgi:magnesium transporter|nr:magnesium transporter CorA family protein [Nitrososphaera sp.]